MWKKYKKVLQIVGITLAVYLGIRYLLPVAAPFFIAWIFVKLIYPLASRIEKRLRIKKEWITLLILLVGMCLLAVGGWFLVAGLCRQIRSVIAHLEYYQQYLEGMLDNCCVAVERTLGLDGEEVRQFLEQNINLAVERMEVYLVPNLVNQSMEYITWILKFLGIFFMVFIAVVLLMKDYDKIREQLERMEGYQKMLRIVDGLWHMAGDYLKAQAVILLIVIVICVAGLWLIGNPYALLAGILIGLLDALPFIGTGTFLIPWALIKLLQGDFFLAASYATLFLAANTTREFLEPRMIGSRLGVYPIVIAAAVYGGMCIYGVAGVLLGPLTLLIVMQCLKELNL